MDQQQNLLNYIDSFSLNAVRNQSELNDFFKFWTLANNKPAAWSYPTELV